MSHGLVFVLLLAGFGGSCGAAGWRLCAIYHHYTRPAVEPRTRAAHRDGKEER